MKKKEGRQKKELRGWWGEWKSADFSLAICVLFPPKWPSINRLLTHRNLKNQPLNFNSGFLETDKIFYAFWQLSLRLVRCPTLFDTCSWAGQVSRTLWHLFLRMVNYWRVLWNLIFGSASRVLKYLVILSKQYFLTVLWLLFYRQILIIKNF